MPLLNLSVNLWATWNVVVRDAEIGEVPGELRSKGRVVVRLTDLLFESAQKFAVRKLI